MAGRKFRAWTQDEIVMLGVLTDEAVAARIGVSSPTVMRKRQSLGIPSLRSALSAIDIRVIRELIAAGIPGRMVGARFGVGQQTVSRIATGQSRRTDGGPVAIARTRSESGRLSRQSSSVPSPLAAPPIRRKARTPLAWSPEVITLMGTMSDAAVGRLIGRSARVVTRKRVELGIQSVSQSATKIE